MQGEDRPPAREAGLVLLLNRSLKTRSSMGLEAARSRKWHIVEGLRGPGGHMAPSITRGSVPRALTNAEQLVRLSQPTSRWHTGVNRSRQKRNSSRSWAYTVVCRRYTLKFAIGDAIRGRSFSRTEALNVDRRLSNSQWSGGAGKSNPPGPKIRRLEPLNEDFRGGPGGPPQTPSYSLHIPGRRIARLLPCCLPLCRCTVCIFPGPPGPFPKNTTQLH